MKYTDAHCHIPPTDQSEPTVVGRICNATRESEWQKLIKNAGAGNFVCIGIHPWHIETLRDGWQARLRDTLMANPHIMVGEVGLDKHYENMPLQIQTFTTQLEIAAQFARPLHLHCVGAWDKILHILKEHLSALPPVILAHGFNGSPNLIQKLAHEYNMYFSYHTPARASAKWVARISATPRDRLLTESDAFDTQSQIQILRATVQKLATILGDTPDELSAQIYTNFQRITSYVRTID